MIFVCDKCHFMFSRTTELEQCSNCGKYAVRPANKAKRLEQFGIWLKERTGSSGDTASVDGFVTAPLTVCIGAMAVVGSVQDGIYGNYSILATKAVLANLSLTGSIMIFCIGINLIWDVKIRVANMLPTLVFAVLWAFLPVLT